MNRFRYAKLSKGILALCVALLTILVILPQQARAAHTERYGYTKLDSENQKQLYVLIADALTDCREELSLSGKKFTESDLQAAEAMVRRDYPELFYYAGYRYSVGGNGIVQLLDFNYSLSGKTIKGDSTELKSAIAAVNQKVGEIGKGATGNDYQKAHYLHDYVVNNVIYASSPNDQNAYGALMEGKAVCAGYSHAYQMLLREVGIDSFYITGTSKGVQHAWLLVFLNGECYYTDVTWDDPITNDGSQVMGHYYFDMSYDDISKDHTCDPEYNAWLPQKHDHKDLCYFAHDAGEGTGVGYFNNDTDPKKLLDYMKRDGNTLYCDFRFDGNNVSAWIQEACQHIANKLGEINISYIPLGNEYMLTITAKSLNHSLTKIPAKLATCISEGSKEHYLCTKCDGLFADPEAKTSINSKNQVALSKLDHHDANADKSCDTCGKLLSSSAITPPIISTPKPTTPSVEPTGPSNDATEATMPSNGETEPPADATEGTTPSNDAAEGTTPSDGAAEDDAESPTKPTKGESSKVSVPMDMTQIIWIGAVIAVIAVVIVLVRKKLAS